MLDCNVKPKRCAKLEKNEGCASFNKNVKSYAIFIF